MGINKNYKNKIFFIAYGIYLVFNILSTSFYSAYLDLEDTIVFINLFCIVLLTLNEILMMHRYSSKDILWIISIVIMLLILFATSNQVMLIACALLFAYCGRDLDFKRIARFTLLVESIVVSFVVFSALTGLITNYVDISNSDRIRSYIGFLYALNPSAYLFNITALSVCISGLMIKWRKIAVLFALNCMVYIMTDSRLSFCMSLAVLLISILLKIRPYFFCKKKLCLYFLSLSFIVCCVFSLVMCDVYDPSVPQMKQLDTFLEGRISLSQNAHLQYGYSLFGQDIEFIGAGLLQNGVKADGQYNYVDNVYVALIIKRGVFFLVFYLVAWSLAVKRTIRTQDYLLACILAILAFCGMFHSSILYLHYNTFWFVIGTLVFSKRKARLVTEKNIMLSGKISSASAVRKYQ